MSIITLDFETYYDDDYSLKKMTTEAYVRDPRFEVLGCGIRDENGVRHWLVPGIRSLAVWAKKIESCAVLCHHAQFDGLILSQHFGIRPRLWLDTLSMARLVVGNHLSVSLDNLAQHYGLRGKTIDYKSFKGKHWHELSAAEQKALADGCLHDVDLTWSLFERLMAGFPNEELKVVDLTVRMFTEPVLEGDIELLAEVWRDEERRKRDALSELGVSPDDLQSSQRFADLLRAEGVEPEVKASAKTPEGIYAFAKTDDFMKELSDDDGRVGDLVRARLGIRSTITQTRAERLGWMATRGPLPVYLRYSGAHTTRWAGGDHVNWQNFPRGGSLRRSIKAPEGGSLIVLDLAQIECIAEGQLVDTRDRGLVPIQDIVIDDFVWDGIEWVRHEGVVCKGEREVLTYDGLTATSDHLTYLADGTRLEFARAAKTRSRLRKARPPLSLLQKTLRSARLRRVQDLWGARHPISVSERASNGGLHSEGTAPSKLPRRGDRPDRQQRPLRAGKSETVDPSGERQQSQHYILGADAAEAPIYARFQARLPRVRLQPRPDKGTGRARVDGRADHRTISTRALENDGRSRTKEARPLWKTKVYDIVNAGPRHRFTVSGVLVSNCRILNVLAGQQDITDKFRNGDDIYSEGASVFYGRPITKADSRERHLGKVLELGCGFGMGAPKLRGTCRAGALGGPSIQLTDEEADSAIRSYRSRHPHVVAYWKAAGRIISRLAGGDPTEWGPMTVKDGRVYLPNGTWLNYTTLEYDRDWQAWKIKTRQGWTKLYGGKLVENVVQALARVVLSQAMLRIAEFGHRIVMTTHDEIVVVTREVDAENVLAECSAEMVRTPAWLPDLPLKVEGGISERYEK